MKIAGEISTKEEIEQLKMIIKISMVAQRFNFIGCNAWLQTKGVY